MGFGCFGTGRDAADNSLAMIFGNVRSQAPVIRTAVVEDTSLGYAALHHCCDGLSTDAGLGAAAGDCPVSHHTIGPCRPLAAAPRGDRHRRQLSTCAGQFASNPSVVARPPALPAGQGDVNTDAAVSPQGGGPISGQQGLAGAAETKGVRPSALLGRALARCPGRRGSPPTALGGAARRALKFLPGRS